MNRYLAFLRGINVGGQKIVKMADLRQHFEDIGYQKVQTYIQSGNVIFDCGEKTNQELMDNIETGLESKLGYYVPVIVRSIHEINRIIESNPFKNISIDDDLKLYICFLAAAVKKTPALPFISQKEGLEIIRLDAQHAFIISHPVGKGRYGFPNNFIEKELGVISTSRNWKTLLKMVSKASQKGINPL